MKCPKCGNKSGVLSTAPMGDRVYRDRICKTCGHRWTTEEVASDAAYTAMQFRQLIRSK